MVKSKRNRKDEKYTHQQCIACGRFDVNRNIPRHFRRIHSKTYFRSRWILVNVPYKILPEKFRPSVDIIKNWNQVNWDWLGLPNMIHP